MKNILTSFILLITSNVLIASEDKTEKTSECFKNSYLCTDVGLCRIGTLVKDGKPSFAKAFPEHAKLLKEKKISPKDCQQILTQAGTLERLDEHVDYQKLTKALAKVAKEQKERADNLNAKLTELRNQNKNEKKDTASFAPTWYIALNAIIMLFLYFLWLVEKSRATAAIKLIDDAEILDPDDVASRNLLTYENAVGPFYRIWRFILRPISYVLLCLLVARGIFYQEYFVLFPVFGIFLLVLFSNLTLVRILFPILVLIGYIMSIT